MLIYIGLAGYESTGYRPVYIISNKPGMMLQWAANAVMLAVTVKMDFNNND